ncbi:MAG: hypothetical protein DYG92_09925 [Leptolyngbya sp. PLA1]|nr:hypothetical protein [Leptolyngbya sp. PLA1]
MFSSWGKSAAKVIRPRAGERFGVSGLSCPLGEVVDISASGMRVRFSGSAPLSKGATATIAVTNEGQSVRVTARVIWIRKGGLLRANELGLQWVNVRPGIAAALVQLGRFGFVSTQDATAAPDSPPPRPEPASSPPVTARIEVEDLYAILGVPASATHEEIRRAFHTGAQLLHPDRNPSPEAAHRFAEISKAWKVLRDADLRERYDKLMARCSSRPAA